jgi:hypothetical protein
MEGEGGSVAMGTVSLYQMMVGVGSPTAEQLRVVLVSGRSIRTPMGAERNTGGEEATPADRDSRHLISCKILFHINIDLLV